MLAPFQGFLDDRLEIRALAVGPVALADAAAELDRRVETRSIAAFMQLTHWTGLNSWKNNRERIASGELSCNLPV